MKSLKDQVKDLQISKKRKDYDIEDAEPLHNTVSDESDGSEDDASQSRNHYEEVGKSNLRKPAQVELGEKYHGVAVSRDAVGQNHEDIDPFAPAAEDDEEDPFSAAANLSDDSDPENKAASNGEVDDDEEIDSDEAFGESDAEKFKSFVFRGSGTTKADGDSRRPTQRLVSGRGQSDGNEEDEEVEFSDDDNDDSEAMTDLSGSDSDIDMDDIEDDDEEGSEEDDEDQSEDEEERSARPGRLPLQQDSKREEMRMLLSSDTAAIASSLSSAVTGDAKKGKAVKKQYQTFDRLLDARIKLQKGLLTANDIVIPQDHDSIDVEAQAALRKAEEAALKLFSTIESLRSKLHEANTAASTAKSPTSSKKRKRASASTTLNTPTPHIWSSLQELEAKSLVHRRTVLDRWSNRIKASDPSQAASASRSKFSESSRSQQQTKLSSVLDTYLFSEQNKLLAASTNVTTAAEIDTSLQSQPTYDDAAFYQSLLRDLINSRSHISATDPLANSTLPLKLHPSGNTARSSRTGKTVDTKASKGRKVRYTVHEKLENFVAAQGDTGRNTAQWSEGAKAEFFGSLFGAQRVLVEDDEEDERERGDGGGGGDDKEVEALRLFRS